MTVFGIIFAAAYLLLLMFSFLFSGSETGFVSLNLEKYRNDLDHKRSGALMLKPLVDKPDMMLSMTILGNNVTNVSFIFIGSMAFVDIKLFIYTSISTILLFVFGEVMPKIIFKSYSNSLMYRVAPLLRFLSWFLYPWVWLNNLIVNILGWPLMRSKSQRRMSRDDFYEILADGYEEGLFKKDELHFFDTISSLSSIKVVEVMKPLVDLYLVSRNQDMNLIADQVRKEKKEILPVYDGRIDNLVGYINIIDVFNSTRKKKIARDFLIEADYVPETMSLDKVYLHFSRSSARALIIVDEYGGCSGVIRENDIISRIFGFEYGISRKKREVMIRQKGPNTYEVDTAYDIDDLNKRLNLKIAKKGYETLGGLVNFLSESIPEEGKVIKWNNLVIRVLKATKTSVDKVQIQVGLNP